MGGLHTLLFKLKVHIQLPWLYYHPASFYLPSRWGRLLVAILRHVLDLPHSQLHGHLAGVTGCTRSQLFLRQPSLPPTQLGCGIILQAETIHSLSILRQPPPHLPQQTSIHRHGCPLRFFLCPSPSVTKQTPGIQRLALCLRPFDVCLSLYFIFCLLSEDVARTGYSRASQPRASSVCKWPSVHKCASSGSWKPASMSYDGA